jgi:dermatan 4-sulfotransferase 1
MPYTVIYPTSPGQACHERRKRNPYRSMRKAGFTIDQQRERWWLRLHPLAAGIDRRIPVEWVVKRATVSRTNRYCYFRIPKCANTTIIKTLLQHDPALAASLARSAKPKRASRGLFRAIAWSPESLAKRYFCFTFVRNPYTRVLSAYLDKIAAAGPGNYAYVAAALGKADISEVSFADFIGFLERGGLFSNVHWAPQTSILPIATKLMSFIGQVENLEVDLARLINRIPGMLTFNAVFTHEQGRRNSDALLTEYYDADLVSRVLALYRDDFESLGYSEQLPVAAIP